MPRSRAAPPASPAPPEDPLAAYRARRNFDQTPEPRGDAPAPPADGPRFVVQKHRASQLHYDLRLELDGVLLSWAVPKGPSYDPADKPIAIRTEDHPLAYADFEGTIPKGAYGAGAMLVWDRGTWTPEVDARQGLQAGKLIFTLRGHKLFGRWELVRIAKPGDKQDTWILFKKRDGHARPRAEFDVLTALPDSVIAKPLRVDPLAPASAAGGDGAMPPAAVRAALPAKLAPQLPTLAAGAPTSDQWLWEIKFDGYRLLARIEGEKVQLITRGGHDWASKMPAVVRSLLALEVGSAWLDGEIVVLGPDGMPSFNALQNAIEHPRANAAIEFFLFDAPFLEGHDLRKVPLVTRRHLLQQALERRPQEKLRFSAAFEADAAAILESSRRMGLEGVMAKRKDAPYESRRTETWLKLKNRRRQEFVIGGWRDRSGAEGQIGALILGVHEAAGGPMRYVGKVGTGWDARMAASLRKQLVPLETAASPFGQRPLSDFRSATSDGALHWAQPQLVAEVEFGDWTPDGQIRHATFIALRVDKPAGEVQIEHAVVPDGPVLLAGGGAVVEGITISNPERVIDAVSGVTKIELARYYASVADWMLPHLKGRACSLVRGPQGVAGELFYQKHLNEQPIADIRELPVELWPGHAALMEVPSRKALVASAQMNVIEFHTWNAVARKANQPDRVVFDLDPGEGVAWKHVQEAAMLVRGFLQELRLQSWLKTSGGKGLHVVVPLTPREGWDAVKDFSEAVVHHLARVIPQRFVAKSGAANRIGRIYVDYLRNAHGATTAAAYSARSRPGLGVSMPVSWDELAGLTGGAHWTVRTAREHLSFQQADPWADYWTCKQTLAAGRAALGLK